MYRVRRFTTDGRSKYQELLTAVKSDGELPRGFDLLFEPSRFVEEVNFEAELPENPTWETRFDFAEQCHQALGHEVITDNLYDGRLWDWIVARYFTEFCKTTNDGSPRPGAMPTLTLKADNWNRYYRHHAAGPIFAYQAHPEASAAALVALANPLDTPGELAEQFLSRQDVLASYSSIGAATLLYIDPYTLDPVTGAAGRNRQGTARRYGLYLKQLELTHDLGAMTPVDLLRMLPGEYQQFVDGFEQYTREVLGLIEDRLEVEVRVITSELGVPLFFAESAVAWLEAKQEVETFNDVVVAV